MALINAWAAREAGGPLAPFQYDPGPLAEDEVEIRVAHCGLCHSDLSMIDDEWGLTAYPLVAGHEVTGTIAAIGARVRTLAVGDPVGLGWHARYCLECERCMAGAQNTCAALVPTIVGRHGGLADRVRAQAASVVRLPEGLDLAEAGPLMCAGNAVFNPIQAHGVRPTDRVAVIGLGGLGHIAVQFLDAWGCHVTAFTSSPGKEAEARRLGADAVAASHDPAVAAAGQFDFILSTVAVPLDWNAYLACLKPGGRLHLVGAVPEPLDISLFPMLFSGTSVSGSPVGSPSTLRKMLDFAARHGISPVTEHMPIARVNEALARLRAGQARYRMVLDF